MEKCLLSFEELSKSIGLLPKTICKKIDREDIPLAYGKVFGLLKWDREEVNDIPNELALQVDDAMGTQKNLSIWRGYF